MVITVTCPSCSVAFPVDSNKIPVAGVNARCSSCGNVFRVERPKEPTPPLPAPEPEPVVAAPEPVMAIPEPEPEPEPEAEPFPALEVEPLEGEGDFSRDRDAEADFSVGVETPAAAGEDADKWVFETAEDIDPGNLDIQPMETVESSVAEARDEDSFFSPPPVTDPQEDFTAPPAPEPDLVQPVEEVPEEAPAAEAAPAVGGFSFGRRDPKEKARRLARVLVSDMIMYNPERHERALANGTLREDFEDEISKSWKEYVEQVGEEMATENPFWAEALNDVLAKGQQIF